MVGSVYTDARWSGCLGGDGSRGIRKVGNDSITAAQGVDRDIDGIAVIHGQGRLCGGALLKPLSDAGGREAAHGRVKDNVAFLNGEFAIGIDVAHDVDDSRVCRKGNE